MQHDGRDRNDCRYVRTRDLHNGDHHHRNNDEHHDFTTTSTSPTATSVAGRVPTDEELHGIWWLPDNHLFRWNADGSYAIDDEGHLVASPEDVGTFVLTDSTLTMESGPDATFCTEGELGRWEVQHLDEGAFSSGRPRPPVVSVSGTGSSFGYRPVLVWNAMMRWRFPVVLGLSVRSRWHS